MFFAGFVLILANAVAINMDGLCPASTSLSTELHGLYTYPVDLFFPEQFKLSKGSSSIVPCTSQSAPYNHSCAIDFKKCPITMDTVELATRRARNWTPDNNFCELRDFMSSYDEVVNIIVFGGSVTVGHATNGCYCESNVDGRCKFKKFFPNQEDKEKNGWQGGNLYCRWTISFARGMRLMSLAKVRIFNFGIPGIESSYSADGVLDWFRTYNLVPSGRDIILIDHSTNDAAYTAHRALVGVESLIRNLYHLSDPVSPPNIVLLAQYPGMSRDQDQQGSPIAFDYQAIYAQVAAHYKVALWSLRDVGYALSLRAAAWEAPAAAAAGKGATAGATGIKENTTLSAAHASAALALRSYVPYLRNAFADKGTHPPWFVHLYMADLYLSILYSEMSKCFSNPALLNQPRVTAVNAAAATAATAAVASGKDADEAALDRLLPARLTNTSIVYCSSKAIYALSVSAEQEGKQSVGTVLVPASWPVVTERNGKVGWVSNLSANVTAPPPQLVFEFSLDTIKQPAYWLVDYKYLRTYENAGIASISLCGKPLKTYTYGGPVLIDGLWAEPERFRFSETATFSVPIFMPEYCADATNKDPERATRGVGALVFTHERADCATLGPGEKPRCEARRSTQKMKLVSVTLCAV